MHILQALLSVDQVLVKKMIIHYLLQSCEELRCISHQIQPAKDQLVDKFENYCISNDIILCPLITTMRENDMTM